MNKEQAFLVLVLGLAAFLGLFIVLPFLEFVLLAVIIAYVLYPLNRHLEPRLGTRVAPGVTILVGAALAIGPLAYMVLSIYRDLRQLATGKTALELATIEAWLTDTVGREIDLTTVAETVGRNLLQVLFGDVTQFLSMGTFFAIGMALVLFLVYYLLRDGPAFVDWLVETVPASDFLCQRLIDQLDRTTHGVIVGHLSVALLQGLVGGFGLWIAGIPDPVFWTFAMIVLSLLPLIGAFLVWVPAAGYLFVTAQPEAGLFIVLWGLLPVSMIDNYARPIVIDRDAHLNPGVILIGVFGGIYAIGFTGLFVGPIVLAVLAATLTVFDEEYDRLSTATEP